MPDPMMPCFWPGNAQPEGIIIGRILTGYGELEYEMCDCLAAAIGKTRNLNAAESLRNATQMLFRVRGEERRINTADDAMKDAYVVAGVGAPYAETICEMHYCRTIRNQFSHCHWYHDAKTGLRMVNLEDVAKKVSPGSFLQESVLVSLTLLTEQEEFFRYVQRRFWYLAEAYRRFAGVLAAQRATPLWQLPPKRKPPDLHS